MMTLKFDLFLRPALKTTRIMWPSLMGWTAWADLVHPCFSTYQFHYFKFICNHLQ